MIYGDRDIGVIVQNITGRQGRFHTELMNAYAREVGGRGVVAGVAPRKGGQEVHGVPVYNTVREALREHDATASVIFVPAPAAGDAIMEAAYAGIDLAVVITEHIPVHDTMKALAYAKLHDCTVIGPNCPGLLSPGECKLGIMPAHLATRGNVGVVSRSGTLTYEVVDELTRAGIGQSTVVGIGGDPVIGQTFVDVLARFEDDPQTEAVVVIGEVGGNLEEEGIRSTDLPVVAYIAGVSAPPEKRMGHAGAIIAGGEGDARSKVRRISALGVPVASRPSEIPELIGEML
ncbi:MAG TPA: succinate--CoA ligase subunit alpha [Candidatus Methanoculleus thermohydrogenotrophicum]|jgi:succinyl-CoA synthetase alpha subunit|nr:succinate--CoA ligase subunit alpha [Candidatus Methanoculleus thermohydrogenotrophicum]NLM81578.1 succinate--CoA ligase subunit alpha [Candidatus Methanoculleus thermohydrogenotrophicum]HOB17083.1 succinate--CoA ligase subunit alpha [Candidatus Methanoculleus thermohydrogenotrophicum]HPZ37163.1 succinate--CoA ligase subunit alpha [Candidatus Methanoculleus thermohydrogenotrophicum]HQC90622.1 succinate--CoA ligase subunit alpha [Candidatus Methanoculleus thermohydrogenotrophicum]